MPTEPKTQAEAHKLREDKLREYINTARTADFHKAFRAGFDACMSIVAEAVIRLTEMREVIQRQRRMTPEECEQFGAFVEKELESGTPTPAVGDGEWRELSKDEVPVAGDEWTIVGGGQWDPVLNSKDMPADFYAPAKFRTKRPTIRTGGPGE